MDHAKLKPSSAARVVQCPGSLKMEEIYPNEETEASKEGTLAHEVNVAMLMGLPTPEGATEEMIEGAHLWLDCVEQYKESLHVEEKVECYNIHPENWGTPDAWHYKSDGGFVLRIWDYKFGHRYVEVYENWQLINYAAGILDKIKVNGLNDQNLYVVMTIVQPRHYSEDMVREWTVRASDLRAYFNRLRSAFEDALKESAPCNTGPECRDCSARHACSTLQKSAYIGVELSGESTPFDLPHDIVGKELALLKQARENLSYRITGLEEDVINRIRLGFNLPGWMIKQSQGRLTWSKSIEEVVALGDMMGIQTSKAAVITPTQAIKAGLPPELVNRYSERQPGEFKLVEIDVKQASKIFGE